MTQSHRLHNIALVGFMGTGKTSVGHTLAAMLHFRMVDTDELIEVRAGRRISAIFTQDGEARFREYERQVVHELRRYRRTVISTGGGLVTDSTNMASLKTHALVVCLWASPEAIWERVRHQTHRPLLHTPDPQARIRELLAEREGAYREADVLLNTEVRSVREAAQQVAYQFHLVQENRSHGENGDSNAGQ